MAERVRGTVLVPGEAVGQTLWLSEPLSFWGGLDAETGLVIDRWHPQNGASLSDRILVMRAGRGSSSGSSVLAEAVRRGTGPAGIVLLERDAIVTVGAMVALELYGTACPVVIVEQRGFDRLARSAGLLSIAAGGDGAAAIDVLP